MRCPACGALNPEAAQWCGQCLHRFGPSNATAASATAPTAPAAPQPAPSSAPRSAAAGSFRRQGDDLEWACPACGQFNTIDLLHCSVCGTAFVEQFRADEAEEPRDWKRALALTALAPGAGHLAVGRYGSGAARLVLFLTWVLGAVLLAGGGGSRALVAVLPLLSGAGVVYVTSLLDIRRLERGLPELLAGRRLLYLVLGVLALLGVGLITSLASAAA